MNTKKIIRFTHLWLGLISGIIVFIVSFTGTLFVFCDEAIDAIAGKSKYVQTLSPQSLSPEELLEIFNREFPSRQTFYFDAYKSPERSFRVASMKKETKDSFTYTYMNPYTGEILKTTESYWFFYVVAHIHSQLLLNNIGKTLVGIATIIFFFELISGLILWFPKRWNSTSRKASFTLKRKATLKRKNYELHKVLGFYAFIPAILITGTGLIMAYEILGNLTQKTFGGNTQGYALIKKYQPEFDASREVRNFTYIVDKNFRKYPDAEQCRISFWANNESTTYYTQVGKFIGLKSNVQANAFFTDKYTGEQLQLPEDLRKHFKIEQATYDLHVGYWGGLTSKIITFIVGLICTSLPVTGLIIWLGKRKKEHKISEV